MIKPAINSSNKLYKIEIPNIQEQHFNIANINPEIICYIPVDKFFNRLKRVPLSALVL